MNDETKLNLFQKDGQKQVWRRSGTTPDLNKITSSVKHGRHIHIKILGGPLLHLCISLGVSD